MPDTDSMVPARSAMIRQGEYKASGRGALAPGTYRLEIRACRGGRGDGPQIDSWDAFTDPKDKPKPRQQYLPAKYNNKSELEPLTVTAESRSVTKDFHLE